MTERGEGLHLVWARRIAASLADCGALHVVLSPGSRSTPLAIAFADEPRLSVTVVVDERAAAFVALGQSRVTGRPSVLLCTSGTALAHYHPAVIEAEASQVPLVVLSADRPLELQSTAASQTIDQVKLFGSHVRRFIDLGVPDEAALASLPRMLATAYLAAIAPQPGPVHVNARFRKPLEPLGEARAAETGPRAPALFPPRVIASEEAVLELCRRVRAATQIVLAAGPAWGTAEPARERDARLRASALAFARVSGAVVVGEVTSGLAGSRTAEAEGAVLGGLGAIASALRPPDLLIQVGRPPVAARFGAYAASAASRVIVMDAQAADPDASADAWLVGDAADLLERAARRLGADPPANEAERRAFLQSARTAHAAAAAAVRAATEGELTEPALAYDLASRLPSGAFLVLGNSTPVRDACAFGSFALGDVTVLHQRGAAGIDGLVAGLAGARLAAPARLAVVALLGDVSAAHDLSSLAVLASCPGPCVLVVVDNGGGRIFEELPVARTSLGRAHLDRLFLTPPAQGAVSALAAGLGLPCSRVTTRGSLAGALESAMGSDRPAVIEVVAHPEASRAVRSRVRAEIEAVEA